MTDSWSKAIFPSSCNQKPPLFDEKEKYVSSQESDDWGNEVDMEDRLTDDDKISEYLVCGVNFNLLWLCLEL